MLICFYLNTIGAPLARITEDGTTVGRVQPKAFRGSNSVIYSSFQGTDLQTLVGWLGWVGGLSFPVLLDSNSICIGPSLREREIEEKRKIEERTKYPNNPTHSYCKFRRSLPYYYPNEKDAPVLKVYPGPSHHLANNYLYVCNQCTYLC